MHRLSTALGSVLSLRHWEAVPQGWFVFLLFAFPVAQTNKNIN